MKKVSFFMSISFVFIAFLTSCATTPEKTAMKNVKSIDFDLDLTISGEDHGFLWCKEYVSIISIDGKPDKKRIIFTPGLYKLEVQYYRATSAAGGGQWRSKSDVVPILFNVERGKTYFLDYVITNNTINFDIKEELTDPHALEQIEKARSDLINRIEEQRNKRNEFFAFSKENPNHLEGIWKFEDNFPPGVTELTFIKNQYKMSTVRGTIKRKKISEGNFIFNENTIILFEDKKQKIYGYELKGGVLNILNDPQSLTENWPIKGRYIKIN
jgi:hypothetical protein